MTFITRRNAYKKIQGWDKKDKISEEMEQAKKEGKI